MTLDLICRWDRDLSSRFPVRLFGRQKKQFLRHLERELQERGFATERLDVGRFGISSRILVTRCPRPRIIFLAHYDTPTITPFWMSVPFVLFGHTRSLPAAILAIGLFLALSLAITFSVLLVLPGVGSLALALAMAVLVIPYLIPNPHNREDNTSGVIGLMALADWVSDNPLAKERVQFAFLDHEEFHLRGSKGLKRLWDRQGHPYSDALIVNLDCVSRGRTPLVVYHKDDSVARQIIPFLRERLPQARPFDLHRVVFSDNYTFRETGAVVISCTEPSLIPGGYHIPRIHTPRDNDFSPQNLAPLVTALAEFVSHELVDPPAA